MKKLATFVALSALIAISLPVGAQQGELGFEGRKERFSQGQFGDRSRGPRRDRDAMVQRQLEKVAEYLELSDEQTLQWQTTVDEHRQARQATRDQLNDWRAEFRQLAKAEEPDLTRLGEIALAIHRKIEGQGSSRNQLKAGLKKILTPEQAEKLESLMSARQFEPPRNRSPRRRGQGQAHDDG